MLCSLFFYNLGGQPFNPNHSYMPRAMLDYTKTVLQKVSFDAKLFAKELKKAVSRLLPSEIEELKIWLQYFILDKPELQPTLLLIKA